MELQGLLQALPMPLPPCPHSHSICLAPFTGLLWLGLNVGCLIRLPDAGSDLTEISPLYYARLSGSFHLLYCSPFHIIQIV